MQYPLQFRFKLIALAPQIYVEDATGKTLCYVKQKMFRLKEKVEVFTDDSRSQLLSTIAADRIIDWSARYTFRDASGTELGAVGRRGLRSLFKAHYDVFAPGSTTPAFQIREENPFIKVLNGIIEGIPVVGVFSGYFLHPRYLASRADGTPLMRLTKTPAFFEGRYKLEQLSPINSAEELNLVLSFLMMNLLERSRG